MKYARVDLSQSNYNLMETENWKTITDPDIEYLNNIYMKYCRHNKFKSVMPLFRNMYMNNDLIGYYDNDELVAFSIMEILDDYNVEALQFAWNYESPKLRLGIKSLKHECALYKARGFKYLYLGGADEYKKQIDGFEILGPA